MYRDLAKRPLIEILYRGCQEVSSRDLAGRCFLESLYRDLAKRLLVKILYIDLVILVKRTEILLRDLIESGSLNRDLSFRFFTESFCGDLF